MKILYIASVRIPSEKASGLAIVRQCVAFADNGQDVTLLIPRRQNPIETDLFSYYGEKPVIKIVYYPSLGIFNWGLFGFILTRFFDQMVTFLFLIRNRREVDILYARDQWMLLFPILFGFSKKTTLEIHTKHTDFFTKYVIQHANKVVAISSGLKYFYESFTHRTGVSVEASGVELEQFKKLPGRIEAKMSLGLPLDVTIFSYVGRYSTMGESKGVEEIIKAFGKIYKESINTHLYIVGLDTREIEPVTKLMKESSLPVGVYTLSELDQTKFALYLEASDVLLMNYPQTEHYALYMSPTKLFAYLAAGKPIVTTDLPSIREIGIMSGVVYVEKDIDTVSSYSEAMRYTLNNLKTLSSKALENKSVALNFSWKERAKRLLL